MKKLIGLFVCLIFMGLMTFAQEIVPVDTKKSILSGLDWNVIFNILMGIIGLVGGSTVMFWKKLKIKARKAGELLIKFADAVDDNNVNANECTDLSGEARELVSKTT